MDYLTTIFTCLVFNFCFTYKHHKRKYFSF